MMKTTKVKIPQQCNYCGAGCQSLIEIVVAVLTINAHEIDESLFFLQ